MKVGRVYTHSQSTPGSTGIPQTAWTLAIWATCGALAILNSRPDALTFPEPFMRAPVALASAMAGTTTPVPSSLSRRPRVKRSFSEIERELQKMFYGPLFKAEPRLHHIRIHS